MESRDLRLARFSYLESIRVPHKGKIGVSIVAETTPLRIVSHCGGNPTKREFNSYCPKSCALDVYAPNMSQSFARRGKIARFRTVKDGILLFYIQALVRDQLSTLEWVRRT